MPDSSLTKLLAGTLLAGAAVLTGDVTLLATASGIGVNWKSEALPSVLNGQLQSDSALAQAGGRAVRKALSDLERQFRTTVNPKTERKSFRLLRESVGIVLDPAYPPGAATLADLQTTLATSLGELLHGHDAQETAFLRQHLLGAVAQAFRSELDGDDAAWRAFHGRLLEQLHARAAQPGPPADLTPLLARFEQQQQAFDALRDADGILEQRLAILQELIKSLEQGQAGVHFSNQDVTVQGNLYQAGGNIQHTISGNQTNVQGGITGPVFSGTFNGPVTFTTGGASASSASEAEVDPQAILREKRRRLHQRELTAARYGINTPPEVVIEIEDLKREIAALERQNPPGR